MSDIIKHQRLVELVSLHDEAQRLADEGLRKLAEAKTLMLQALGQYNDTLIPRNHAVDHWVDKAGLGSDVAIQIRENFWKYTLSQAGIRNLMGSKDRDRMDEMFEKHTTPPYDVPNLVATLQGLAQNSGEIFQRAVKECFDWLRPCASRHKTNSKWAVGPKVIITAVTYWQYGSSDHWSLGRWKHDRLADLDRVFHGLDGQGAPKPPHDAITAIQTAMRESRREAETDYFRFRWFKSGTLHVWFKRDDLRREFNRIAGGNALAGAR